MDGLDGSDGETVLTGPAEAPDASRRGPYRTGRRRRAQILDEATSVFSAFGYRASTLQEIADRVGVSRAAVLRYFGNKEELFLAVLQQWDYLQPRPEHGSRGLASLRKLTDLMQWHTEHRGLLELYITLVAEAVDPEHPAHDFFKRRFERSVATFERWIMEAAEAGEIPPISEPQRNAEARAIMATLDGIEVQWLYAQNVDLVGYVGRFVEMTISRWETGPATEEARADILAE